MIRRQLLFKEGDTYTQRLIDETERLLRANRYIKTARIMPVSVCDNRVDLRVITTDSWTLTPGISFGRSGGVNTINIDVEEHNLLGYGKELSFNRKDDNERVKNSLLYEDNNLLGTRNILRLEYQDNSDGTGSSISTGLPFYHFAGLNSWKISASSSDRENLIYEQGIAIDSLGRENKNFRSYYAWAEPSSLVTVNRYKVGWAYSDESSFATEKSPTLELPEDTIYSSPFIGWQYIKQNFVTRRNLFGVGIIEDISLGADVNIELGWVNKAWNSTHNFLSFAGSYSQGFQPDQNQLLLLDLGSYGLYGNNTVSDVKTRVRSDWFLFHNISSRLHLIGIVEFGDNLSIDNQISLGGDTGLRGYPLKYQNGDRKFLFSIEERYLFDWYPYRILKTGVTIFADIGSAWDSETGSMDILRDVGFGFVIASTRQSTKKTLRIDFAFPLDDTDSVDSFQLLIGVEKEF